MTVRKEAEEPYAASDRREEARRQARELLGAAGLEALPVDVAAAAEYCGVRVQKRGDLPDGVAGFLFQGPLWDVIVVNAAHARTRQRFTVGHELGHWWIGEGGRPLPIAEPERDAEEAVDAFAAELLMPEHLVAREWDRCTDLPTLCYRFGVSRRAMTRRLQELGLMPPANGHRARADRESWDVCQLPEEEWDV